MILSTPLGEDALVIASIEANEGISRLYRYHIEAWGDPAKPVALHKLLRQPVCVWSCFSPTSNRATSTASSPR